MILYKSIRIDGRRENDYLPTEMRMRLRRTYLISPVTLIELVFHTKAGHIIQIKQYEQI